MDKSNKLNDYSHALVKEISAQLIGYQPSHVWGKLTRPTKKRAKNHHEYLSIMRSRDPSHLRTNTKAYKHATDLARKYIQNIPRGSHIKKNGFQGL